MPAPPQSAVDRTSGLHPAGRRATFDAVLGTEIILLLAIATIGLVAGRVLRLPAIVAYLVAGVLDPLVRVQYLAEVTDRLARIDDAVGPSASAPDRAVLEVFRHIHTMKVAASAVGDEPMAWFCHGLEERLRLGTSGAPGAAKTALDEVTGWRAVLGALVDEPVAALAMLRGVVRPRSIRRARPAARAASSAAARSCTSRGIVACPSGPAGHRPITTTSSGFASSRA